MDAETKANELFYKFSGWSACAKEAAILHVDEVLSLKIRLDLSDEAYNYYKLVREYLVNRKPLEDWHP